MEGLCEDCRILNLQRGVQGVFLSLISETPFHISCARILLQNGANADTSYVNNYRMYPLFEASLWNNYGAVKFLLFAAKVDINCLSGPRGLNALAASDSYKDFSSGQDEESQIARLLIEQGIKFQRHVTYNHSCYRYRRQLATCRLAQRALEVALKKCGVHKDVIPIVEGMVWSTRVDAEWRGCNYE